MVTIDGIHHVNIRAPARDIAQLREFYCEVVGLSEGWRPPFESRGHWLYAGDRPVVHLVEGADDAVGTSRGVDHVAFQCSDFQPVIDRLKRHGVEYRETTVPSLGDRQLAFRDPLGIGVELSSGGGSG